jgi:hypothetical protein
MRKSLFALVLALGVSGCATGKDPGIATADFLAKVRSTTEALCAFVPTAATVAGLFNVGFTAAGSVAAAICQAVLAAPRSGIGAKAKRSVPVVNGVPIRGYFK